MITCELSLVPPSVVEEEGEEETSVGASGNRAV